MFLIGLLQLAKTCDVLMMVWLDILMYRRKQSLDHLPKLIISHLGQPMAAAVVAAPMRRECDVVLASPFVESERREFISFLVRNLLFEKVNSGPVLVGCFCIYFFKGTHRAERCAICC